jgi:hypothetical protein
LLRQRGSRAEKQCAEEERKAHGGRDAYCVMRVAYCVRLLVYGCPARIQTSMLSEWHCP